MSLPTRPAPPDPAPVPPMRRVALASFAGTTIEFYDFFIYGTAAALVFGKVYFPALGAAAATVAAFATFGVAFLFRPLGAVVFGHLGDRRGRKSTLIYTLLLMGLSTVAVGLLPGTATIGVAAPIALVALRALQGVAVGGAWAGAALLAGEYAPPGRRGRYGMFPQLGPAVAFGLSSSTFLVAALTMSRASFLAWGWRIPFLASSVLVVVGLYIRLRISETPVFRRALDRREQVRIPMGDALRHQWREVVLVGGALTPAFALFYIGSVYLTSYAGPTPPPASNVGVLGLSRPEILTCGAVAAVAFAAACAVGAVLSDRFGRRRVILAGNLAAIPVGPVAFLVMAPGSPLRFGLALSVLLVVAGVSYGPAAAYLPEMFATRYRYSGTGMGYNLAGLVGAALPLVVAPPLAAAYGGAGIGWYLAVLGLVGTLGVLALDETRDVGLERLTPAAAGAAAG